MRGRGASVSHARTLRERIEPAELAAWQDEDLCGRRFGYLAAEIRDDERGLRLIVQLGREEDRAAIAAARERSAAVSAARDASVLKAMAPKRRRRK